MIGYESTRRMVHNWLVQPVIDKNIAKGMAQGIVEGEARGKAQGIAQGIAEGEARGKAEAQAESDAMWLDYIERMRESYEKGEPFDEPTPAELRKNGNAQE